MIDEWGVLVLFALGAGFLQGWISITYTHESGLFLGISFLVVAALMERRRKKKLTGGA